MMRIIDCGDTRRWQEALDRCNSYDVYHTAAYHEMSTCANGDRAVLFVYEEGEAIVALPLILRPLVELDGLREFCGDYCDATSVYGYSGPVTNRGWADRAFFERFGYALRNQFDEMDVIAAFSRLHPILQNDAGLTAGEVVPLGETVSINLTLSIDEQFCLFRKSHRYEIRKARAENIVVVHDMNWEYYDDFVALYLATMRRANADARYYFNQVYFDQLRSTLGEKLHLFVAKQDKGIISAALFTLANGIVEYHLAGTFEEKLNCGANKLVLDAARLWASAQGASVLHLGGGLGSQSDSLFFFKAGFSPQRHTFKIWRYVVDPTRYALATQQRCFWLSTQGYEFSQSDFFPLYRSDYEPRR